MGKKKIVVPCLDVIMIAFFPRNILTEERKKSDKAKIRSKLFKLEKGKVC